ncbi:MAG: phosphodiesterase [Christensenellaceae bacterium]|jgi:putative phosphoesterase|nr:phosphodiesterase [Christensenellaceae bacterium]
MKYVIASDIHGSSFYGNQLIDRYWAEEADRLILLGDLYYHGPRNPLPVEYDPQKLIERLNQLKDRIIAIQGNCDSEIDKTVSEFEFHDTHTRNLCGYNVTLTHGHSYNITTPPLLRGDILLYGHYHIASIKVLGNGVVVANPGSISLPKNNSPHAYLVLTSNELVLKSLLSGDVIDMLSLPIGSRN